MMQVLKEGRLLNVKPIFNKRGRLVGYVLNDGPPVSSHDDANTEKGPADEPPTPGPEVQ